MAQLLDYIFIGTVLVALALFIMVFFTGKFRRPTFRHFFDMFLLAIFFYFIGQAAKIYGLTLAQSIFQLAAAMVFWLAMMHHARKSRVKERHDHDLPR
jgi:hypothetical protein